MDSDCECTELTEQQLYEKEMKPTGCIICDKPLVVVGHKRKNGKNHDDWETRDSHKNCFLKKYGVPKK